MGRGWAIATTVAALALALPSAAAAKGTFQYVDSKERKLPAGKTATQSVTCPNKTTVVSGGVEIKGANTATAVVTTAPIDGKDHDSKADDGWKGAAVSRSAGDKKLVVHATCAKKGKFAYYETSYSIGAHDSEDTVLICPGTAVGGGIQLQKSNRSLGIGQTSPYDLDMNGDEDDGWNTYAYNDGDTGTSATTYLICATNDDYSYVSNSVDSFDNTQTKVSVDCPGRQQAVGGGGEFLASGAIELAGTYPADLANDGGAPDGWTVRMNNFTGDDSRDASVYAICR